MSVQNDSNQEVIRLVPEQPSRKKPVHGVFPNSSTPTVVFVTICTKDRDPWLAFPDVHTLLAEVWQESLAWLVGRYIIMPDHIHLFAGQNQDHIPLDNWVRYFKSQFTKRHGVATHRWQSGHWDTRLRVLESYESKWEYVRNNPVRHGLVTNFEEWDFQGELNVLPWLSS